jgi:hypothetical protein
MREIVSMTMRTLKNSRLDEFTILARLLSNGSGQMTRTIARYLLKLDFTDEERTRMHDLAVRNQDDALSPEEKEEMFAYGRAGTMLEILQAEARLLLKTKSSKSRNA